MPISYDTLSIRGTKRNPRVPVTECNLETLNLLIPGGAPILVPKHRAWGVSREARKKKAPDVEVTLDEGDDSSCSSSSSSYYQADSEEEEKESAPEPSSHVKKKESAHKRASRANERREKETKGCKKTRVEEKDSTKNKQKKKRVHDQEAYIARLREKYAARAAKSSKGKTKQESNTDAPSAADDTSDAAQTTDTEGATTDGSEKVREMIRRLKIRAGAGASVEPFTASEDAQLLALKKGGDTWAQIVAAMPGRSKNALKHRFKELETEGAKIHGEDVDADAGGGDKTDATTSGGDMTTDAEKTDDDQAGDLLGGLMGALEEIVEAATEGKPEAEEKEEASKEDEKPKKDEEPKEDETSKEHEEPKEYSAEKLTGKRQKEKKQKQAKIQASPSAQATGPDDKPFGDEPGTKLYIAQYARHFLDEEGQGNIPEPDDKFDEYDCLLLAMADSLRRRNRWMEMQSTFANITGRMVPVQVLKYKFGEAEKPDDY